RPVEERRSFDSRVGNICQGNILIFSPNTTYLFDPPTSCRVRLRRDYHFGTDDPLYFPQPFDHELGHLAILLCPSHDTQHEFFHAWFTPGPEQFNVINTSLRLGKLEDTFFNALTTLC
ncbi:hypothetical protein GYMLUDRAFT_144670, partial [Collybiopsis luxurians FD-317 M1]